jgi:anti-sigma-K factor RskA
MNPSRWSLDEDPPRDVALARLLRSADPPAGPRPVDWDRLHTRILAAAGRAVRGPAAGEWWDVVAQWRRGAVAASVAAILAAAALWQMERSEAEVSLTDAAPETAALARVVVAYPDEAVFSTMVQDGRTDELVAWESR